VKATVLARLAASSDCSLLLTCEKCAGELPQSSPVISRRRFPNWFKMGWLVVESATVEVREVVSGAGAVPAV